MSERTQQNARGAHWENDELVVANKRRGARVHVRHCYKQRLLPSQWKLSLSFPALPLIRCHSWHKHKREKERSIKSRKRKQVTYYWPWMEKEEIDRYIGLCLCLWGTESKSLSTLWWQSLHSFNILTLFVLDLLTTVVKKFSSPTNKYQHLTEH